ncbi:tRNA(Ile)-lysidine synthase [Lachnospiraceae bacterium XBB1006]|nr:tRNA(Ile)-lysidine synthase [Lachnospiraceae bacterium XBB1006]
MKQVFRYIEQQQMIRKGDKVLVGVSGGADSVCLLRVLLDYRSQVQFSLAVLTVEHGIRGEASLKDMEFVKTLCADWKVPCYVKRVDVPALVSESGMSEEEAARELRYEALYSCGKEVGATKIAVAHHANDLMETMLFFLCRGTGLAGLHPMDGVDGMLIRPLLGVSRKEIEDYLLEKKIAYCTDATNADETYTRNFLRHQVMPLLLEVNSEAVRHFGQTAQHVAEAEEVLWHEVMRCAKQHSRHRDGEILLLNSLCEAMPYLQKQVILLAVGEVSGKRKDTGGIHVSLVQELFTRQVGSRIDLPHAIVGERSYEGVLLRKAEEVPTVQAVEFEADLPVNGSLRLPDGGILSARVFAKSVRNSEIPDKTYTKWLDYDIIKNKIKIRPWKEGDYFLLDKAGHRKTIKKYFVDEKIPLRDRKSKLVLAKGDRVYWILGHRISYDARVTEATRRIMEITIDKGERTNE